MMNTMDFFIQRCIGFEFKQHTDVAIKRLTCNHTDVYRGIKLDGEESDSYLDSPILACRFWNNTINSNLLAIASDDGRIAVQNTSQKHSLNSSIKGVSTHHENSIFDIAWMPNESKLVTVSGDHTAKLWNVSNSFLIPISEFQSHTGSIKTVVFRPEDKNVFATGGRDGAIFIWDIRDRNKKPDNSIFNGHRMNYGNGVKNRDAPVHASPAAVITGLAFQDTYTLISCSAGDGFIKIWDLRKNYAIRKDQPHPKHVLSYGGDGRRNGFSSLAMCPFGLKIYVNCIDHVIYTYNLTSYNKKPIAKFYGHQNSSYYVKNCVSPDGRYLASGSDDGNGYIWRTDQPGLPFVRLKGHTQEVSCISWSKRDEPCIVTSSLDCSYRIWRVGLEHPDVNDKIEICGNAEAIESIIRPIHSIREKSQCVTQEWCEENRITLNDAANKNLDISHNSIANISLENCAECIQDLTSSESKANISSPIKETYKRSRKRSNTENEESQRSFDPMCNTELQSYLKYNLDENTTSQLSTLPQIQTFSTILTLPNFVTERTAPHLITVSPEKSRNHVDWLTKIRKTRFQQKFKKCELVEATNTNVTPTRTKNRSRLLEKHMKSPGLSLLNFFKVESHPVKTGGECIQEKTESPSRKN